MNTRLLNMEIKNCKSEFPAPSQLPFRPFNRSIGCDRVLLPDEQRRHDGLSCTLAPIERSNQFYAFPFFFFGNNYRCCWAWKGATIMARRLKIAAVRVRPGSLFHRKLQCDKRTTKSSTFFCDLFRVLAFFWSVTKNCFLIQQDLTLQKNGQKNKLFFFYLKQTTTNDTQTAQSIRRAMSLLFFFLPLLPHIRPSFTRIHGVTSLCGDTFGFIWVRLTDFCCSSLANAFHDPCSLIVLEGRTITNLCFPKSKQAWENFSGLIKFISLCKFFIRFLC